MLWNSFLLRVLKLDRCTVCKMLHVPVGGHVITPPALSKLPRSNSLTLTRFYEKSHLHLNWLFMICVSCNVWLKRSLTFSRLHKGCVSSSVCATFHNYFLFWKSFLKINMAPLNNKSCPVYCVPLRRKTIALLLFILLWALFFFNLM